MNFQRWPQLLGQWTWPNAAGYRERDTYQKEVDFMKDWLKQRMEWIDREVNK